ncbi:MAG: Dabb family protein [Halothermotrichaceae bacterium]
MIKHIVMFKLKELAEGKEKSNNAKKIKIMLEKLTEKIEELNTMEVGLNINDSEASFDIVLYSEFDNQESLNKYQVHSEHQKVVEFVRKVIEKRVVVDYQV